MINQNWMMRRNALGNFHTLLPDVTIDPAMLMWLNGNANQKGYPNENYAREMLELFTLGQGRGYNQDDVDQNARALTGWTNDWSETRGPVNFRFDPKLHDDGVKKIFGHRRPLQLARQRAPGGHAPDSPLVLRREALGLLRRRRAAEEDRTRARDAPTSRAATRSGR